MFDENGERHQRRQFDGWKLVPLGGTISIALFGWGVSVETRLGTIQSIQAERTVTVAGIQRDIETLDEAVHDPAPRPQAKVLFDRMDADFRSLDNRLNRLEERFNNFHTFLLQVRPTIMPPSRRGEAPFKLEERG